MADIDQEEQELLALQEQFTTSNKVPAAQVKKSLFKTRARDDDLEQERSHGEHVPGERVEIDLSDSRRPDIGFGSQGGMIKDIVERDTVSDQPENASSLLIQGSVKPKKIDWRNSKQPKSHTNHNGMPTRASQNVTPSFARTKRVEDLQSQIDLENTKKIQGMTAVEIEAERNDLLARLDPGVLAAIDRRRQRHQVQTAVPDHFEQDDFGPSFTSQQLNSIPEVQSRADTHRKHEETPASQHAISVQHEDQEEYTTAEEALSSEAPHVHTTSCYAQGSELSSTEAESVHFPARPTHDLDPNSASFLTDLKSKYFAHLDHDPSSLAWMQPPSEAEDLSDYHPSHESLMPAQLRFDFQGNFLAPRTSREVDADVGLHHHADAPLAAGYTIPELAHLARSSYPSQACIAIQTLGRVMYKVAKQYYGQDISGKLQALVEKTMVEATLLERARDRHMGVSSYATEALWQANLGREGTVYEGQ